MEKFNWINTIERNIRGLKIVGLWPDSNEGYIMEPYTLYAAICINGLMVLHVLLQAINIFVSPLNVEVVVEIPFVLQEVLGLIKIYTFMKNIKMLKQLLLSLNGDIFQPKNLEQILLVQPNLNSWKMMFNAFKIPAVSAVLLCGIIPVFSGSYKRFGLPFPSWYPFDIKKSPLYQIVYTHQIVSVTLLAIAIVNIDMLISALMMYIATQCDILCDNLRNIGYHDSDEIDFEKSLKSSIRHHQHILSFSENYNAFISFMVLVQFFISALTSAFALFQMASFEIFSLQFCSGTLLFVCILVQTSTYCWFGNEVELKSNQICYAAFESNWMEQSLEANKTLIIFIIRSLRPIRMSSYKIFYLTLDTYKKILQTSWSYFTMLRQIDEVNSL